jgi:hypothetical protein
MNNDDDASFEVSLPHSLLLALLPTDAVEVAIGPTLSWVGAWDPMAYGGTLLLTALIEPEVLDDGHRRAPSLGVAFSALVDSFGKPWILLGMNGGYDWY